MKHIILENKPLQVNALANQLSNQLQIQQQQQYPQTAPPLPTQLPSSSDETANWANFGQMAPLLTSAPNSVNTPSSVFATPPQSLPVTPNPPPSLPPLPVLNYAVMPPTMNILLQQQQQQMGMSNIHATPINATGASLMMMTPVSANSTGSHAETFEQKWDRIQAAKHKTNPFAEDIAKKYEIKL